MMENHLYQLIKLNLLVEILIYKYNYNNINMIDHFENLDLVMN